MKSAVLCILLIAAAWALPKSQDDLQFKRLFVNPSIKYHPKDLNPRITNGVEAVPHSIPYQAYLIVTGSTGSRWLCGGSLISPSHVLTAGHCVANAVSAVIYLGAHDLLAEEPNRLVVESHNLIPHEEYDKKTISNDIGVIVLDEPVELNEYIDVVALPNRNESILVRYTGSEVRMSGWGRVSGVGETSPVLLEVNSTVISNSQCNEFLTSVLDSHLCTSGNEGVGACSGDSGGPLLHISRNIQIGIVSYGSMFCIPGYPSGFTRINYYFSWIEEKTGLKL